jgi:nitric oxide dioxygenase
MDIIKATAPVLEARGLDITTHFYKRILGAHPELTNTFNMNHQATGAQQSALAHAVWAYASNIDNLGALASAVSRIAHKHASLGILAEHYPVVGAHLLASISEVLGDAVDDAVLDAWKAAYFQLADIFIGCEKKLYDEAAARDGGWNGWREFVVARKVRESEEITSFHLVPRDGKALPVFKPGQFVSVRLFVHELGLYQSRQYSLSGVPGGEYFRISVKREYARESKPAGLISNVLHEAMPEGSVLDVSMPYGDFTLDVNADTPVVLISGGVGLTPMMAMLQAVVESKKERPVVFVHAARNGRVHAMGKDLVKIIEDNPQVSRIIFYKDISGGDVKGVDYDFVGKMDLKSVSQKLLLPDADYYVCGPVPFMSAQRSDLEGLGVAPERIRSELFSVATS